MCSNILQEKKLGMLRWVNYQNLQIQKNPVYDILKYITVAAAIVLIVLIIVGYRKKKELLGKIDFVMIVIMQILGIIYLGITVLKSIESFPAYYFLMPFLGAATLMQIIRNGIIVQMLRSIILGEIFQASFHGWRKRTIFLKVQ